EEVRFGFFREGGLDAGGTQTTNGLRVRKCERPGISSRILLNSNNHGNTAAADVFTANQVARALGSNHDDGNIFAWLDVSVANVEAVTEHEGCALFEVRSDLVGVQGALNLVGRQDDNNIGFL